MCACNAQRLDNLGKAAGTMFACNYKMLESYPLYAGLAGIFVVGVVAKDLGCICNCAYRNVPTWFNWWFHE